MGGETTECKIDVHCGSVIDPCSLVEWPASASPFWVVAQSPVARHSCFLAFFFSPPMGGVICLPSPLLLGGFSPPPPLQGERRAIFPFRGRGTTVPCESEMD